MLVHDGLNPAPRPHISIHAGLPLKPHHMQSHL